MQIALGDLSGREIAAEWPKSAANMAREILPDSELKGRIRAAVPPARTCVKELILRFPNRSHRPVEVRHEDTRERISDQLEASG